MKDSASINLLINKNSDFEKSFYLKNLEIPTNLTGFSAVASIKQNHEDTETINFTIRIEPLLGKITISLPKLSIDKFKYITPRYQVPANYLKLAFNKLPSLSYVWDLILINPVGLKTRLIEGGVVVTPGVSS